MARIVIVGAGIGGLAAALRLAADGHAVTVVEAQPHAGGKIRTLPSAAGPVDAGPTVLTMRGVFDDLFAAAKARIEDHVTLTALPILARHYWDDGTRFDLMADPDARREALRESFGPRAVREHERFAALAGGLFDAFDAPMMQAADPRLPALAAAALSRPGALTALLPWRSLAGLLRQSFRDPRLRQLYARYSTYVGGLPGHVPALLALISASEARGVWAVQGGIHRLAEAIRALAEARGAEFRFGTRVQRIEATGGRASGVATTAGRLSADAVLFNGDPRALATGLLGEVGRRAVRAAPLAKRSLSASVLAFAARAAGPDLAHHTVFFGHDPAAEFASLARGERPRDATLYVCAEDRGAGTTAPGPGPERFEIILNAPPDGDGLHPEGDPTRCLDQVMTRLQAFDLTLSPRLGPQALTQPRGFARLFPASQGALYGQSPHGMTAALHRPRARSLVAGLYLCGGGTHPGAGIPMATLSARHAVAAMLADLALTSPSPRAATPGGISTRSATTGGAPSRS